MQYLVQYDRTGSLVAVVTPSLTRHEFSRQFVGGMTRVRYQLLTAGALHQQTPPLSLLT